VQQENSIFRNYQDITICDIQFKSFSILYLFYAASVDQIYKEYLKNVLCTIDDRWCVLGLRCHLLRVICCASFTSCHLLRVIHCHWLFYNWM